ncbi:MAG: C-GCAxxG-C-C family protein [Promethearchaeota archaeon]
MAEDSAIKASLKYFSGGYNCAQAVFRAISEHKGVYIENGTQLASGFGGGITHSGQQCGALSGAIMAIGLLVGKNVSDVREHKAETYRLSAELLSRFKEQFGTIICDTLTGVKMSDSEARKNAIEQGRFQEVCPKFVKEAVRIVTEMFP